MTYEELRERLDKFNDDTLQDLKITIASIGQANNNVELKEGLMTLLEFVFPECLGNIITSDQIITRDQNLLSLVISKYLR